MGFDIKKYLAENKIRTGMHNMYEAGDRSKFPKEAYLQIAATDIDNNKGIGNVKLAKEDTIKNLEYLIKVFTTARINNKENFDGEYVKILSSDLAEIKASLQHINKIKIK